MSSLFRALFNNSTSKHKKLSENWDSLREPVVEGVTFYCKYLGSCLVEEPKGEVATAEAIKRIIQGAKQESRTPQRVSLNVSLRGITAEDAQTNQLLMQTSIYRISYCSADAHYDHVFAYIANNDNDTCECHAYLCPKRKKAQAVTVSIAQAFELAYESWKMETAGTSRETDDNGVQEEQSVDGKSKTRKPSIQSCVSSPIAIHSECGSDELNTSGYASSIMGPATSSQALLIDLEESFEQKPKCRFDKDIHKFFMPEDFDVGDVTDEFSSLALRHEKFSETGYQTAYSGSGNPFSSHSNVWESAGSSSNESSTATSPTTTTANFFDQSTMANIASSPNSSFLMMYNSPPKPLQFGFTELKKSVTQSAETKDPFQELDPLSSAGLTVDSFETLANRQRMATARDPFAPSSSSVDPFLPIQSSEVSTTTSHLQLASGGSTCGVGQTAYASKLFSSSDLLCS
ncbi:unnamed protein product, partial [Meganyctiphanes norvegica]